MARARTAIGRPDRGVGELRGYGYVSLGTDSAALSPRGGGSAAGAAGVPEGYERLKDFTRGRTIDAQALAAFIDTLPLPQGEKARLKALTPRGYTGLAARLAKDI